MSGTKIEVPVDRAVDGDTVRVMIGEKSESVRISCLDTEESLAGGGKPVTPLGKKASDHAKSVLKNGRVVTLEFEGDEPAEVCLQRYRDNFGRLLAYLHVEDDDFVEDTIRQGYSPYFCKYGNARFVEHHRRYTQAERAAIGEHLGVWDQLKHNGSVTREYPDLTSWWALRASIVDDYRRARGEGIDVLDSRLHFAELTRRAGAGGEAVVFTELRELRRLGSRKAIIDIGSVAQPFKVFVPDIESSKGQKLVHLLEDRYLGVSDGATVTRPLRGYAYVRGTLKLFGAPGDQTPEIVVDGPDGLFDSAEEALAD
ncbi:MAG: thermonuclease family protein [Actinomycetes bacterium]